MLPIPISPSAMMSAPAAISSIAIWQPRASASAACCGVIAGSRAALARAHADFGGNQVGMRGEIRRHAGIDDANRDVAGGGKGVGAGATGQIGHHHRHRHGGGILRDAFLGEAMVGGEHQQHGLVAAMAGRDAGSCRAARPDPRSAPTIPAAWPCRRCARAWRRQVPIERRNRRRLPEFLQIGRHRVPFRLILPDATVAIRSTPPCVRLTPARRQLASSAMVLPRGR